MKQFKVWIHVEEVDEDQDLYVDVGEPVCVFETPGKRRAMEVQQAILDLAAALRPSRLPDESDEVAVFEIAHFGLAMVFDEIAEEMDVSDEEMQRLRDWIDACQGEEPNHPPVEEGQAERSPAPIRQGAELISLLRDVLASAELTLGDGGSILGEDVRRVIQQALPEQWAVVMESDVYGSEEFGYDSLEEAEAAVERLKAEVAKLDDGIERHYEIVPPPDWVGTEGQDRQNYTDDQDRENYAEDPYAE